MQAAVQIFLGIMLATMLVTVLTVHILRGLIAAKFLNDEQFERFKENGMMGEGFTTEPSRWTWEYQFVRSVLERSGEPRAALFSAVWRWSCRLFLASGIAFGVGSIIHAFL